MLCFSCSFCLLVKTSVCSVMDIASDLSTYRKLKNRNLRYIGTCNIGTSIHLNMKYRNMGYRTFDLSDCAISALRYIGKWDIELSIDRYIYIAILNIELSMYRPMKCRHIKYRTFVHRTELESRSVIQQRCLVRVAISIVQCFIHLALFPIDEHVRWTERRAAPNLRLLAVNHLTKAHSSSSLVELSEVELRLVESTPWNYWSNSATDHVVLLWYLATNYSTPLQPQSRFVDKSLGIRLVCPQIGTAVLKGSRVNTYRQNSWNQYVATNYLGIVKSGIFFAVFIKGCRWVINIY